jgi:glutamyl endopeptidase
MRIRGKSIVLLALVTGAALFTTTGAQASDASDGGSNGYVGADGGGGASPMAVFGPDDRHQVTSTTTYPERTAGLLTATTPNGPTQCSASLIGPGVVLTSGGCIHTGGPNGKFFTNVKFFPGRNGSSSPYGTCTPKVGGLYTTNGWRQSSDERYDIGLLKLGGSCATIGNNIGYLGYVFTSTSEKNFVVGIPQYPGADHPTGTQWFASGKVLVSQTLQNFYNIDTSGGSAGAPLVQNRPNGSAGCAGYCVIGVHSFAPHGSTAPHSQYNHGHRLTRVDGNQISSLG